MFLEKLEKNREKIFGEVFQFEVGAQKDAVFNIQINDKIVF